ncbi:NlpC/P60 family protein [Sphaerisporangium rhizosphaerae]|uniref:NlpC/P60 domain-containing protein n=1 Tax=Sphaerisporangium rhizosphaerae TaxID=2269375 RepID=A0ABW2PGN8_9ACTN
MSSKQIFIKFAILGVAVASPTPLAVAGAFAQSAAAPSRAAHARPADVTRQSVIDRAKTWNPGTPQRVPYSQGKYHNGYRTDCSGYASMALGLSAPGLNTVALASPGASSPIAMSELLTGDLVIDAIGDNNNRHVVIFEQWANPGRTSYWAYEQRGGYGTDHRVLTYGLRPGSEFHARRPRVFGGGGTPSPGGKVWVDTFADATGYREPNTGDPQGTLDKGTNYVYCRVRGAEVRHGSAFNHWWLRTDLDRTNPGKNGRGAYVSAYYLAKWGNDEAKDNNGRDIPNC